MNNVVRLPLAIDDEPEHTLTLGERRIRDAARYVNRRIANLDAGKAWLDVGRELAELKAFLAKHSKSDSRDGWLAAFAKGKSPFVFSRRHADRLIQVHEKIGGHACPLKNLPASIAGLIALSRLPDSHRSQVIAKCQSGTTEREVRRIAKEVGWRPAASKARLSPQRLAAQLRKRLTASELRTLIELLTQEADHD